MGQEPFVLGAVADDLKVVTIWEGFKTWVAGQGFPFDYVLFSNYERQANAQMAGLVVRHVGLAARLGAAPAPRGRRGTHDGAVAMRDTDQGSAAPWCWCGTESDLQEPARLAGRTVATGAIDSPAATLLPLAHLAVLGLGPGRDFAVRRFDVMGGSTATTSVVSAMPSQALMAGEADAACAIDGHQLVFAKEGMVPAGAVRVLARTEPYDHCTMTVLDDVPPATVERFVALLRAMSYDDPAVRPLLQLEGLKEWRPGRTEGYAQLEAAVDRLGFYGADRSVLARGYDP